MDSSNLAKTLIFTDLDGSLLDHYDYSFTAARPLLRFLEHQSIPVICCTSKTFAELKTLRESMNNAHPFIVENGAAVYIPQGYFAQSPQQQYLSHSNHEGYDVYAFVQARDDWLPLIKAQQQHFANAFIGFSDLGVAGIAKQTGLSLEVAVQANQREFSEPIQWLGSESDKALFISAMTNIGANILQGGRFLHVSGACDKGQALKWLAENYQQQCGVAVTSVAVGDSGNDIAMLEAADKSLIIRSPVHEPPQVNKEFHLYLSQQLGTAGWVEGISNILNKE